MKSADKFIAMPMAWVKGAVWAMVLVLPAMAYGAGVAMVTDRQGKATMTAEGRARDLTILAEVDAGTQVQLAAGATLVALYLAAGDEYVFKGPAAIVFKAAQ